MATKSDAISTSTATVTANGGALSPSKAQRKQQERAAQSLAFLARIERIHVTGTTYRDEHEQVQLKVVMKDQSYAAQLSARAVRKDAKTTHPSVDYENMKALSTLKSVHAAVHQWSTKHPEPTALDGTSRCGYCSQFNSPAALKLWRWNEPSQQETQASQNRGAALTVVVNNRSATNDANRIHDMLQKIETCLNNYLESARTMVTTDAAAGDTPGIQSECQGHAHIPALVASFLQNEDYTSVTVNVALFSCQVM